MPVCGPIQVPLNRKSRSFWLMQSYASQSKKRRAVCEIFLGEWRNALAARLREFMSCRFSRTDGPTSQLVTANGMVLPCSRPTSKRCLCGAPKTTSRNAVGMFVWLTTLRATGSRYLFPSRLHARPHISTRQYVRLVNRWVESIGLCASQFAKTDLIQCKTLVAWFQFRAAPRLVRLRCQDCMAQGRNGQAGFSQPSIIKHYGSVGSYDWNRPERANGGARGGRIVYPLRPPQLAASFISRCDCMSSVGTKPTCRSSPGTSAIRG